METLPLQIPWTSPMETGVGAGLSSDGQDQLWDLLGLSLLPRLHLPSWSSDPQGPRVTLGFGLWVPLPVVSPRKQHVLLGNALVSFSFFSPKSLMTYADKL